jgi:hypothetical protein
MCSLSGSLMRRRMLERMHIGGTVSFGVPARSRVRQTESEQSKLPEGRQNNFRRPWRLG